ncbi:hypothetical protein H0N95_00105 [Candidatus Micrarchaeota archaeon]|nr:hypothetical protein [Candidatus Micrarchaeota archaeon]
MASLGTRFKEWNAKIKKQNAEKKFFKQMDESTKDLSVSKQAKVTLERFKKMGFHPGRIPLTTKSRLKAVDEAYERMHTNSILSNAKYEERKVALNESIIRKSGVIANAMPEAKREELAKTLNMYPRLAGYMREEVPRHDRNGLIQEQLTDFEVKQTRTGALSINVVSSVGNKTILFNPRTREATVIKEQ